MPAQKPLLKAGGMPLHLSANSSEETEWQSTWLKGGQHTIERLEVESKELTLRIHERQMAQLKEVLERDCERTEDELETEFKEEPTADDKIRKMSVPLWRRQEQLALALLIVRAKKKAKKAEKKKEEEEITWRSHGSNQEEFSL